MYIKNISKLLIAAALTSAVVACDEISPDDRYIKMDEIVPQRAVLLVDLTGQNCINCPEAHEVIESLEEQYGDSIIAVSMHAGGMALPYTSTNFGRGRVFLRYAQGDTIDSEYNTLGNEWPSGVLNLDKPAMRPADWSAAVRPALTYAPGASIVMQAAIIDHTRVGVTVSVSSADDFTGHLGVWLLEDSITALQSFPNGVIKSDYVHNNVFRRAFGSVNGIPVSLSGGEPLTFNISVDITDSDKEIFNHDNLKVVAFVRDDIAVVEAARAKVSKD